MIVTIFQIGNVLQQHMQFCIIPTEKVEGLKIFSCEKESMLVAAFTTLIL